MVCTTREQGKICNLDAARWIYMLGDTAFINADYYSSTLAGDLRKPVTTQDNGLKIRQRSHVG